MREIITEEMRQIRTMIVQTVAQREQLKQEMHAWYATHPGEKFAAMRELITVDAALSALDTHYKQLWDEHNARRATA